MWAVYGEESGEYREFRTKKEAMEFVRECERFDKDNQLEGEKWRVYKL